jgi:hypothetical protein
MTFQCLQIFFQDYIVVDGRTYNKIILQERGSESGYAEEGTCITNRLCIINYDRLQTFASLPCDEDDKMIGMKTD